MGLLAVVSFVVVAKSILGITLRCYHYELVFNNTISVDITKI